MQAAPVAVFHSLTVLSHDADASSLLAIVRECDSPIPVALERPQGRSRSRVS